jgi:hypothetical protein
MLRSGNKDTSERMRISPAGIKTTNAKLKTMASVMNQRSGKHGMNS